MFSRLSQCWFERISNELSALSKDTLSTGNILTYNFCWESSNDGALRQRNYLELFRTSKSDGKMQPQKRFVFFEFWCLFITLSNDYYRKIYGSMSAVPWGCELKWHQQSDCYSAEKEKHQLCRLYIDWFQSWYQQCGFQECSWWRFGRGSTVSQPFGDFRGNNWWVDSKQNGLLIINIQSEMSLLTYLCRQSLK